MKTTAASALRSVALLASLLAFPVLASARNARPADPAAQVLGLNGSVPVKNAGPYVESGTFQIQVSAKLGRPAARLDNGAWLYPNFTIADSNAAGTLVVHFNQGRVSELSLVTPAVAMAMSAPKAAQDKFLVAYGK